MPIKINYITFQKEPEYHMYMSENSLLSSEEKGFLEKNNISTSNISETIYYDDTIERLRERIQILEHKIISLGIALAAMKWRRL